MSILKKIKIPDEAMSAMVYMLSSVISKSLAIITVPIFTRMMPAAEVGVVSIFTSWYTLLSGIVSLGLTSGGLMLALNRFNQEKDRYISSILSLTTLSGMLVGMLFLLAPQFFESIINLPKSLLLLMILCFIIHPAYDFWLAKQRYDYKYKLSGIIMISNAIISAVVSILAVLLLPQKINVSFAEARLFGTYFISLGTAFIIWINIFIKGKCFFNVEYWRFSLFLGVPLIGQMLAAHVLGVADRIMIQKYCGYSEAGIYSTVYTIGTLTTMLWTAINGTFTPFIYKNIENNRSSIRHNSFIILMCISLISVFVVLFGPEIARILGPEEYQQGIYIIPPVAAGVYLIAIGDLYSDLLIYAQKTTYIMIGTAIAAVLNILLNSIFIPAYGYIAAAYTTLISYVCMSVLLVLYARKTYKKMRKNTSEVYKESEITLVAGITIFVDMLLILTYKSYVIRYIIIGIVLILVSYLANRFKLIESLKALLNKE